MSEPAKAKKKRNTHFWRACRFLWPYRGKIALSVTAAVIVGLCMTGGLGTMLPIMRVLINGDTVQAWVYRQVAGTRLGATFSADPGVVQIAQIGSASPLRKANLGVGTVIESAPPPAATTPPSPFPSTDSDAQRQANYRAGEILRRIAWAGGDSIQLIVNHQAVDVNLVPLKWTSQPGSRAGLWAVQCLPIRPVQAIGAVFALLAGISVIGQVMRFFQEHMADQAAIRAVNDVRRRLYDRVLRIPIPLLSAGGSSDATSRLVSDTDTLQDGFKTVLGQSIQEPIKAIMALILALSLSWRLTLFIIGFAPLMAATMKKFGKKMRRASRAALRSSSSMLGQIEGTLAGIQVVKVFNAQRFERRRYMRIMNRLIAEQLRMSYIDALSGPVMETFIMLMAGFVVMFAAYMILVARPPLDPSKFILVMISLAVIAESLRRASKVNNSMQKSNAAAARIFEILDLPMEANRHLRLHGQIAQPLAKLPPLHSRIQFQHIHFTYPQATAAALCDVDLTVPKGQSVAIVGRNGSGKTTLLRLLCRLYEPPRGRILVDGVDIQSVTLNSLRDQISLVTQESHLFPGTIAQNIAYGDIAAEPDAPDSPARRELFQRIGDAARRAFAHDFILEKPQGYDTVLGEMGGQLSGGQRQRVCIARAIFRQTPILILDEATSQVDAESEHLIQQAIEQVMHERTTFVIAHRLGTILSADTIVVMERGRIVGQGRHDDLLRNCETYQQLYERQLVGAGG